MRSIRSLGLGKWRARGWGIDLEGRKELQIRSRGCVPEGHKYRGKNTEYSLVKHLLIIKQDA